MKLLPAISFVALGALLASCSALGPTAETRSLRDLTDRTLGSSFGSSSTTFGLQVVLSYAHSDDQCFNLPSSAYGEAGGTRLEKKGGYFAKGGGCVHPWFEGVTLPLPALGDGTLRVVDGDFEVSMTVKDLFTQRTAVLRAPATALKAGDRVYLDLAPSADEVTEISVAYFMDGGPVDARGYPVAIFTLHSYETNPALAVVHDTNGWSFTVPAVVSGAGRMDVATFGPLNVLSSTNVVSTRIDGQFLRQFRTTSVP
jgi:hypothetical protein